MSFLERSLFFIQSGNKTVLYINLKWTKFDQEWPIAWCVRCVCGLFIGHCYLGHDREVVKKNDLEIMVAQGRILGKINSV